MTVIQRLESSDYKRLFDIAPDMMCFVNPAGEFTVINRAVTEILGWELDAVLGQPFMKFVHPDDHAATVAEFDSIIRSGKHVLEFENRYRHKDHSWRTLSWRSVPMPEGVLATARDVTELREKERSISKLNAHLVHQARQLEAANRELEAFAYSVAHDLRAPLRAIDGFSRAVMEDAGPALDSESADMLSRVRAATVRMGDLIDDLLGLSRVSRVSLEVTMVDLTAVARAIAQSLQASSPGRSVEFRIAEGLQARGDSRLLRIALENLLGNSWKFTSNLAGTATIEFCQAADGAFFVRDNGAGFDQAYSAKLFQPFQRLHSPEEFPGTGIGLATVQRVVSRHGGKAWAEGVVGHGATVHFSLNVGPIGQAAASQTNL